ncbi:MAG: tagaturonate epimerase family protein [Planctomycetota bacterium]
MDPRKLITREKTPRHLEAGDADALAGSLRDLLEKESAALPDESAAWTLYPASAVTVLDGIFLAARKGAARHLLALHSAVLAPAWKSRFTGTTRGGREMALHILPANEENMAVLRSLLPFLRAKPPGTTPSFGFGDRLGLATPGHVAAVRGSGLFPILAQQSIRELARTNRTPRQVMDDATFGAFLSGYADGFGADADHLKTTEDIDRMAGAGFNFFTLDPSAFVDDHVNQDPPDVLRDKYEKTTQAVRGSYHWRKRYLERSFVFPIEGDPDGFTVTFDEETLFRTAVKYGRAVKHAAEMAQHASRVMGTKPFEIEMSVDETSLPTTTAEHLFIVLELQERQVHLASLAPRFTGHFEKGVDYKGDPAHFETALRRHKAISQKHGAYKISVHSGSDKFAVYPALARVMHPFFHVKTAGTSYLEALRVAARKDTAFFREIVGFCRDRYDTDKATYHVSAALKDVAPPDKLPDARLEGDYLDKDPGRQILHVTFGSVLLDPALKERIMALLVKEEETYDGVLKTHLGKHVKLLAPPVAAQTSTPIGTPES